MIVASVVLPRPGRAVEEDVVGRLSPAPRRREQHRQVGLDVALADVFVERPRPEGALDDAVTVVEQVRCDDPGDVVGHRWQQYHGRSHLARPFDAGPAAVRARTTLIQVGVRAYCRPCASPAAPSTACERSRTSSGAARTRPFRWGRWPSATTCRRSSSSRSWRRSSTAASSGRRWARGAATRWPTTRRRSRSVGSSGCSTGRSRRCRA